MISCQVQFLHMENKKMPKPNEQREIDDFFSSTYEDNNNELSNQVRTIQHF